MKIIRTMDYQVVARLNKPVHDLHVSLYPHFFKEYDYETISSFFEQIISSPNFIFLLLEEDNQSIGYVWIEIIDYPDNPFRHSYRSVFVHQISIVDGYKNKGYGSKLMEKVYQIARLNNAVRIELDYWAENQTAKDFYKKQGFVKNREFVYKDI